MKRTTAGNFIIKISRCCSYIEYLKISNKFKSTIEFKLTLTVHIGFPLFHKVLHVQAWEVHYKSL